VMWHNSMAGQREHSFPHGWRLPHPSQRTAKRPGHGGSGRPHRAAI